MPFARMMVFIRFLPDFLRLCYLHLQPAPASLSIARPHESIYVEFQAAMLDASFIHARWLRH